MYSDPGAIPMADPIAYFITWATYGTWLPGDERGWVEFRHGWHMPDPFRKLEAAARMTEDACRLNARQRDAVHEQVAETCRVRGWTLHAVNCRSNHMHLVVTAPLHPKLVRSQLKAWCTRKLNARARQAGEAIRENWWAERGSQRYINDQDSLAAAILYVLEGQEGNRYRADV